MVIRTVRIKEYSDQLDSRKKRTQQAKPLALHGGGEKIHTSNVATGSAEARDDAEPDRVGANVKTIGMVAVAALAAMTLGRPPVEASTATLRRTRSAAISGRRS